MGLTLKWLLPPAVFTALMIWTENAQHPKPNYAPLYLLSFLWFAFAFLVVGVYWVGRLIRRGGRDADRR